MTMGDLPSLSLVVPTHNRKALLAQLLDAVASDPDRPKGLEIVVVADGCSDGTQEFVRSRTDLAIRLVELPGVGPAEARNRGAEAAGAPVLMFLDDDVVPAHGCLGAHAAAHAAYQNALVLGSYPSAPHATEDYFHLLMRGWWQRHFSELDRPGHRLRYTDVLTGNMSIRAEDWKRLGGLDTDFAEAHEDYEFGIRVFQSGMEIIHVPKAAALHYEHLTKTPEAALKRAWAEGIADVQMVRKHPEVAPDVQLMYMKPGRIALTNRLVSAFGGLTDSVARGLGQMLPVLQRKGLRGGYGRLYGFLRRYWYVRGVSTALPRLSDWRRLPMPESTAQTGALKIDLGEGYPVCETRMNEIRPRVVEIWHGPRLIGVMPDDRAAEAWAGRHLRPFLLQNCGVRLLQSKFLSGEIPADDRFGVVDGLYQANWFFGQKTSPLVWHEQYSQWARLYERLWSS
jgi:GT2 family glycosyltransferase